MSGGLLLFTPSRTRTTRLEWAMALRMLHLPTGREWMMATSGNGQSCEDARNGAVHLARELNQRRSIPFEFLMFYDDDILPKRADAIVALTTAMAEHPEISVLGGVYPRRQRTAPEPIVVKEPGGGVWWGWQDGGLHRVYMTGTGFTIIRLADLDDMDVPEYRLDDGQVVRRFFQEGYPDGTRETDDFYFARLCQEQGKGWYVHGGVVCVQADLNGETYDVNYVRPVPVAVARNRDGDSHAF